MITITLCDKVVTMSESMSLFDMLCSHGYNAGHFAIAINRQFVPRSQYSHVVLKEGDVIDVISPMQGG